MRINSLDALRGLAALAVVLHHCFLAFVPPAMKGPLMLTPVRVLIAGPGSVMIFFALSGFVLFLGFADGRPFRYAPYVVRRLARIYLPFAAAILISAGLYALVQSHPAPPGAPWSAPLSAGHILWHLAMTDAKRLQDLDIVMWTLVPELRISLVFPLIAWAVLRDWRIALTIAAVLSGLALWAEPEKAMWLYDPVFTARFLVLFVGGAVLSLKREAVERLVRAAAVPTRAAAWVAALLLLSDPTPQSFGLATAVAALAVVALSYADPMAAPVLAARPAAWLGRVSYSLYLLHLPILLATMRLLDGRAPAALICILTLVLSLAAAGLSQRFIEAPAARLGRRLAGWLGDRAIERPALGAPAVL